MDYHIYTDYIFMYISYGLYQEYVEHQKLSRIIFIHDIRSSTLMNVLQTTVTVLISSTVGISKGMKNYTCMTCSSQLQTERTQEKINKPEPYTDTWVMASPENR